MENTVILLFSFFSSLMLALNRDFQQKNEEATVILFIILFNIGMGMAIYYYMIKRNNSKGSEQTQKLRLLVSSHLLELKNKMLVKEEYETSTVYIKIRNIVRTLVKIETKENLNEEEWKLLTAQTDAKWNHIITHLKINYDLSVEEVKICCLYLADVPVKDVGHFVNGYARSTIQLKARAIVKKIGFPQGSLLKQALHSLSNELANVN